MELEGIPYGTQFWHSQNVQLGLAEIAPTICECWIIASRIRWQRI